MSRLARLVPTSGKVRAGMVIVLLFVLIAIFGPMITPFGPRQSGPEILSGPSSTHWLGTTQLGQDVFSQFVHGARVSLLVGLFAGVLSQIVSVVVGLIGGYLRGTVDDILYILTSVFLVIPGLPLLVVLTGWLPTQGMVSVALVITITSWAGSARVLRSQTLSLRNRDFVEAARATGESRLRIIFAEILPNALPIAGSGFIFSVIGAILAEAGLSFLGIGSLTTTSWGSMLYFAQNSQALRIGAWWWFIPPGFAISAIGAGLALINFGIDEYANPRLRTERSRAKAPRRGVLAAAGGGMTEAAGASADVPVAVGEAVPEAPLDSAALDETAPPSIRPITAPGDPIITVEDLVVDYPSAEGTTRAVDDVSITLHRGELLGLAGESGSGKSTLTNAITRLLRNPAKVVSGSVTYHRRTDAGQEDVDVLALEPEQLRTLRWTEIAIVFQSAMNALNPVITVGQQFDDVIAKHRPELSSAERREIARDRLEKVGIDPDRITSYPHELSGGMKQRVAIAIALVLDPEVIIMDEPTTALDLLVQREVLDQIMVLREAFGFAIIFTTHDLSLLLEISDSIAIMQRGRLVEYGPAMDVYTDPGHPYTRMLLQSLSNLGAQL